MKKRLVLLAIPLALVAAGTAWGAEKSLQDPGDGSPPQGFAYSSDAQGAQVTGVNVSEFRKVPLVCDNSGSPTDFALGGENLVTILRLRKAGTLAVFSHLLDCDSCAAACDSFPVCDGNAPPAGKPLVSMSKIAEVQACLLTDLSEDVGSAIFDDPNVVIKLKNVEDFVAAPPIVESLSEITQHFVADVELSVK